MRLHALRLERDEKSSEFERLLRLSYFDREFGGLLEDERRARIELGGRLVFLQGAGEIAPVLKEQRLQIMHLRSFGRSAGLTGEHNKGDDHQDGGDDGARR